MDINKVKKIARKYRLRILIMFGSQVQGKTHKESDLDLTFYPTINIDEETLLQELMDLFKRADIDLINLKTTHNHSVRYEILSTGKVLFEAEKGLKSKMEWQSYFDFVDFKKYYDLRSKLLDKKIEEMIT